MAAYTNNNALYFIGSILAVSLGFRLARRISNTTGTTIIVRLLATTYCLCTTFFMYSALLASLTMLSDFSWVFSQLSEIRGISPISQKIIDSDTTLPRLVNILLVLSVLGLQMIYIWSNTEE